MLITAYIEVEERPEGSSDPVRVVGRSDQGVLTERDLPEGQVYVYSTTRLEQVEEEVQVVPPELLLEIVNQIPQPEWTDISYDDEPRPEEPYTFESATPETPDFGDLPTETIPLTYEVVEYWAVSLPLVE